MDGTLSTARLIATAENVRMRFAGTPVGSYYNHTLRVANYAGRIAAAEAHDPEMLTAAALVHDVGMSVDPSYMGHPIVTAEIAPRILAESGFTPEEAHRIAEIACAHHPAPGDVLEDSAKQIIFDADWLDLVGVLGFMRWYGRIPEDLADLSGSARLFLSIVSSASERRGGLFYTVLAKELGLRALVESIALSQSLVAFVDDAVNDSADLRPTEFMSSILRAEG